MAINEDNPTKSMAITEDPKNTMTFAACFDVFCFGDELNPNKSESSWDKFGISDPAYLVVLKNRRQAH